MPGTLGNDVDRFATAALPGMQGVSDAVDAALHRNETMNREVHGTAFPPRQQTRHPRVAGTPAPAPATPMRPPVETHWTRLLHYDLFNREADDAHIHAPRGTQPGHRQPRRHGARIAVRVAACVAAAGLAYVLVPHAAAATTQRVVAHATATATGAPVDGAHVDESSARSETGNTTKRRQPWV
jgi:hypothetical protein